MIGRIHHCIADGIAPSAVLMSIADAGADLHHRDEHADWSDGCDGAWLAQAVLEPLTGITVKAIVKANVKALNWSVSDVLQACAAGSIGEYCNDRGEVPGGKDTRAMVPVNLRPLERAWQPGNWSGLAPVVLPIGIDKPVERVYAVRERMRQIKGG